MLATVFAAVPWNKRPKIVALVSDLVGLAGSDSPYGEQGNQRDATLRRRSGDDTSDSDGGDGGGD